LLINVTSNIYFTHTLPFEKIYTMIRFIPTRKTCLKCLFLLLTLAIAGGGALGQSGPGGVGNATGANGQPRNMIWFDASSLTLSDTNPVETWLDISGNDNHATQSTPGARPLYRTG